MMYRQRKAFSMITAIFLILMMASVGMLVMSLSGKIVQGTTAQYQKEQAVLLAKSYTELAIMTVMSNDRITNTCIDTITGLVGVDPANGIGYNVQTTITYIAPVALLGGGCTNVSVNPNNNSDELNIIVDIYVRYKDINHPTPLTAPWMKYHRRTLQTI